MKITTITNIETSAKCNLACQYCMSASQHKWRDTGLMDMDTFEATMKIVKKFVEAGTQREINLFGVGEPLLNENIIEMIKIARKTSPLWPLHLNTNAFFLTKEVADKLRTSGINHIDITGHDHFHTAKGIKILRKAGIRFNLTYDFVISPNNWAGQVDWFPADYKVICPWITRGQAFVMWNGDIVNCCFDAKKTNVLGNVKENTFDQIKEICIKEFELCKNCHQRIEGN